MRLFFLLITLFFIGINHPAFADGINECNEAEAKGVCKDVVETAINVCEENQSEKSITAKKLKSAQDSKFDHQSNFGKLVSKFKDAAHSAKTDKEKQKLCQKAMTALKKDCNDLCTSSNGDGGRGSSNGASCDDGKKEIDKIKKLCKKNEEAAEMVEEIAEQDAALFANAASGGTNLNNGTTGGGTTGGSTTGGGSTDGSSNGQQGYISLNPAGSPDLSNNGRGADALGGGGVNAGGLNSGDGAGADSAGDTTAGLAGATTAGGGSNGGDTQGSNAGGALGAGNLVSGGRKLSGSGSTNTPDADNNDSNRVGGTGDSDDASAKNKNGKDHSPGYMFWGTPKRKVPEKRY
jgi:hypothetical protein